jgi:hypothetical protein
LARWRAPPRSRRWGALEVATADSTGDLAQALTASSSEWLPRLDHETAQARGRAVAALTELESALGELSNAASAAAWVRGGKDDGRLGSPASRDAGGLDRAELETIGGERRSALARADREFRARVDRPASPPGADRAGLRQPDASAA